MTHNQSDTNLDYCTRCGGALRLVEGTEPKEAADTGVWEETYECESCGGTGTYHVDQRGDTMDTRATGVTNAATVASYGKHYQRKQARSQRADYERERVIANDRVGGGSR